MGAPQGAAALGMLLPLCSALLDLMGPSEVKGVWKAAAVLPCSYAPAPGFVQQSLAWSVVHDQSSGTMFRRDGSSDTVLLAEYRGRVEVPRDVPGNVSLHILKLEISDRGTYTCQVTWVASNNSLVAREISMKVNVVKVAVTKPTIVAGALGLAVPAGASASLTCVAHGSPPISYRWFRVVPGGKGLLLSSEAELAWGSLQPSHAGMYYCEAQNTVGAGTAQRSDAVELTVRDLPAATLSYGKGAVSERPPITTERTQTEPVFRGTSATSWTPWASTIITDLPVAAVTPENGVGYSEKNYTTQGFQRTHLPLYLVILIAAGCGAVVFLVIAAVVHARKPKNVQVYEVERHNSMTAEASSRFDSMGHYEEPISSTENNYVMEPTNNKKNIKGNEYNSVGNIQESEYEVGDTV